DGKITPEEAADIYRKSYWDAVEGDHLHEQLGLAMFESAVNPGVGAAVMFLQAALGVSVDGVIGLQTRLAIEKADGAALARRVADMRTGYWIAKGMRGTKRVFLRGWMNRARSLWKELTQ
ncbi:MAG TPA: putative peptidoglycan-binding domain-containing protein, partial [Thermoleophilia bacterium]|nr:putative peptidoglycan-binding domain-containing protein [Thermoleophilia bacterium]